MPRASVAANVLISYQGTFFVQGFYAHRISVFAKSKKLAGAIITVSHRNIFFRLQNLNAIEKTILRRTKLSFIQLGGGIATGVYQQQKKSYSLTTTPEMWVRRIISLGVQTTTPRVCSQLLTSDNHPADMEFWERPLRYHHCSFHDLLCEPSTYCFSRSDFITYSRWQLSRYDTTIKRTKAILKKIICLTIETGSLTGIKLYSSTCQLMWLTG